MWKDFFSENSNASMVRLLSFMIVVVALLVQCIVMYLGLTVHGQFINNVWIPADTNVMEILTYASYGLLGLGLGSKVAQKFGEKSNADITPK